MINFLKFRHSWAAFSLGCTVQSVLNSTLLKTSAVSTTCSRTSASNPAVARESQIKLAKNGAKVPRWKLRCKSESGAGSSRVDFSVGLPRIAHCLNRESVYCYSKSYSYLVNKPIFFSKIQLMGVPILVSPGDRLISKSLSNLY